MSVVKELNVGMETIISFLEERGVEGAKDLNPNSKLRVEVYELLQKEFASDKDNKKRSEVISISAPAEVAFLSVDEKALPADEPVPRRYAAPIEGPKIVGKVVLKTDKKGNEVPAESGLSVETPEIKEEAPQVAVSGVMDLADGNDKTVAGKEVLSSEKETEALSTLPTKYEKLEGPKVVGKIELSGIPERTKKKRTRVQIEKPKKTLLSSSVSLEKKPKEKRLKDKPKPAGRGVVDEKAIQNKIRETQAKLSASGGGSKTTRTERKKLKQQKKEELLDDVNEHKVVQVSEFLTLNEFAILLNINFTEVIAKCMGLGLMVSINQRLDAEVMELIAEEYGYEIVFAQADTETDAEVSDLEEDLQDRAPVVTIMGHVDHGKTSLIDYIRTANVVAGEAGGITQKIGAYEVTLESGRQITFLDTPGHEAFTAMRARGTKVADIAVVIIAADDAVMPQTKEAIAHAQAAGIPIIFAFNKVDKAGAQPDKIREQLSQMDILVEEWGGKYQSQEISAKSGLNVSVLLEKIVLEADLLVLKANPDREVQGTVLDSKLDKGRGYLASVLVQSGTLKVGDVIVSGQYFGKVKALFNERNHRIDQVAPAMPALLLGLNGNPPLGERFKAYATENEAKEVALKRAQIQREQGLRIRRHITLDEIGRRLALGNFKELNVIIKANEDGSVEALADALQKLSTEEVAISVIHKGVGQIIESDIMLAAASDAIIIAFQVRPSAQAAKLAQNEDVQIKTYSVIYHVIEEIKSAMEGMLQPAMEEKIMARLVVKQIFKFDKNTIAGAQVTEGKLQKNHRLRVIREGMVVKEGELASLKRYKDDVKEVGMGMECGIVMKDFSDFQENDEVEVFVTEEIKRNL